MKTFTEFLDEAMAPVMDRYMSRMGVQFTKVTKVGGTKYTLENGASIYNDGYGLQVKDSKGKEIDYFSNVKLDYKKAVESAIG